MTRIKTACKLELLCGAGLVLITGPSEPGLTFLALAGFVWLKRSMTPQRQPVAQPRPVQRRRGVAEPAQIVRHAAPAL